MKDALLMEVGGNKREKGGIVVVITLSCAVHVIPGSCPQVVHSMLIVSLDNFTLLSS